MPLPEKLKSKTLQQRTKLRNRPGNVWARMIDNLDAPQHVKFHAACVVWWDYGHIHSESDPVQRWHDLDYVKGKLPEPFSESHELRPVLRKLGYPSDDAKVRSEWPDGAKREWHAEYQRVYNKSRRRK